MPSSVLTLVPIFLVIAIGWLLRRRRFPGGEFWPVLDRLVYYVVFPALLVRTLARADLAELDVGPMALAIAALFVVQIVVCLGLGRLMKLSGPATSSLLQGAIRMNTYAGFAVSGGLFGAVGVTLFSVVTAIAVPTANVISVAALALLADGRRPSPLSVLRDIASNPLIVSVLGGVALNLSGIGLPWPVAPVLDILGDAALPLALLAVGAGIDLSSSRAIGAPALTATVLKLAAAPALMVLAIHLLGIEGVTAASLIVYACLPSSPAAYILARQLGGEAELMAAIIALTTLAAILSMPIWFGVLL